MALEGNGEQERRRFIRLPVQENIRALDSKGRDIGRVEIIGAGGIQIRLSDDVPEEQFAPGATLKISVVEPGNVRNDMKVEIRVRDGKILGVQFVD